MKRVSRIQTFDGLLHESPQAAQRHLDKLYGDLLLPLCHKLVHKTNGKYGKTADFLDANLETFAALLRIKQDMTPEHQGDEEP